MCPRPRSSSSTRSSRRPNTACATASRARTPPTTRRSSGSSPTGRPGLSSGRSSVTRRLTFASPAPTRRRSRPATTGPQRTSHLRSKRGRGAYAAAQRRCDALYGAGSPRLVLVREPDQLRVERADELLAFGVRLIELAEPNRHVAGNDDRMLACPDDDHLRAARVARRRDESEPGKQLELAVDRHVPNARRIDPIANGVVVQAACVVELLALDIDRSASEEVVAAAVVEVQVRIDDDVDALEIEVLLGQRV